MKRIVFVCTGNTCRSPMAEFLMKDKLKKLKRKNVKVTSCGLAVDEGSKTSFETIQVLKNNGINAKPKRAVKATDKKLNGTTLILCMSPRQKKYLHKYKNAYTLGEVSGLFEEVYDPFGCPLEEYERVYNQLDKAIDKLLEII